MRVWNRSWEQSVALGVSGRRPLPRHKAMFDWPLASHTSPTRMSVSLIVLLPARVMVCGVLDVLSGLSLTFHAPVLSAVVLTVWPAKVRVIFSLAAALPQIGTAILRWRTICDEKSGSGLISAFASGDRSKTAARSASWAGRFMRYLSCLGRVVRGVTRVVGYSCSGKKKMVTSLPLIRSRLLPDLFSWRFP